MTAVFIDQPGKAAELSARVPFSAEAKAILQTPMSVRQALAALVGAGHPGDALRLAARSLPRREAVWWACQCCRAAKIEADPVALPALESAEKWVLTLTDEHRRAAGAAAETGGVGTAAGQAAMAAFWSGGSMAPPKLAAVPPAEHLLPTAAGNAALLAGVGAGPLKVGETYAQFVALALAVAEGKNRWKEEKPGAPSAAVRPATRRP